MKKQCSSCQENKPLKEFNFRDKGEGLYQYACKTCTRLQYRTHYRGNKKTIVQQVAKRRKDVVQLVREYKSKQGCKTCGETHPSCLEFHHLDDNKEYNIATHASTGYSWERLKKEMKKCVVVCTNCHRKIHDGVLSL